MALILASASPRRRELLSQLGVTFEVRAADIDETVRAGEGAAAYVERLAREKSAAIGAGRVVPAQPMDRGALRHGDQPDGDRPRGLRRQVRDVRQHVGDALRGVPRGALDALAAEGKVLSYGRGRARRWTTWPVPGFTTTLLLPAPLPGD